MGASIVQIPIAAYGQPISGIQIPVGSTVLWTVSCQDPTSRLPLDLTGTALVMTVCAVDIRGNPIAAPIISRQATVLPPASGGVCTFPWAPADTVPGGVPVPIGLYGIDIWNTDLAGNRLQQLSFGMIDLTNAAGLPGALVTPLPAQLPLGQGLSGVPVPDYATRSAFPTPPVNGILAWARDSSTLYIFEGGVWIAGGGAGSLPAVTSADNNKALLVVNGVWAAAFITADMVQAAATATLSITSVSSPQEAGVTIVNPQFTATYSANPSLATVTGPDAVPRTVTPPTLTALGYGGAANTFPATNFIDNGATLNKVLTWTYQATINGFVKSATSSITCQRRAYYGMTNIATYNSAFVTGLSTTRLQAGFAGSYAVVAGDGVKYAHIALENGWGDPSLFKDSGSGLPVSFTKVASGISVTNANGVVLSYNVWRSPQQNVDPFTYVAS